MNDLTNSKNIKISDVLLKQAEELSVFFHNHNIGNADDRDVDKIFESKMEDLFGENWKELHD